MKPSTCLTVCILLILSFVASGFSNDLIIDKNGNEIDVVVDSVNEYKIFYKTDGTQQSSATTMNSQDVFMIKYHNGSKLVLAHSIKAKHDSLANKKRVSFTVLGSYGTFGLFNVDNVFTKSRYTLGATSFIEYRVTPLITLGVECMLLYGIPDTTGGGRYIINPNIRAKGVFYVHPKICVEPVIACGASFWPKESKVGVISPTYYDFRSGWNARAALGVEYILFPTIALTIEIGYTASSSVSRNVWITHDMMMVSAGPKINF